MKEGRPDMKARGKKKQQRAEELEEGRVEGEKSAERQKALPNHNDYG